MQKFVLVLLGLLAGVATECWPQDLPQAICLYTDRAPSIDGRGDEAVWQHVEPLHLVDVSDLNGTPHSRPTQVRLLWDADAFYMLFTAVDPDVWSTLSERDAPLYNEEVVELFIDPNGDGFNYVEIQINAVNTLFDVLVSGNGGSFPEWDPEFRSAVSVAGSLNNPDDIDQSWTVELALPWAALATPLLNLTGFQSLPPNPGDRWRFNFYRYERLRENGGETGTVQYSAWSPTGAINFHVPERFGLVIFSNDRVSADGQIVKIQDEGYPPGTLVPTIDLALQPTQVQVPEPFRDQVPTDLTLNLPPGFSASVFAVGLRWPRVMAFDDQGVLHLANAGADQIIALPDRNDDGIADEHIVAAAGFRLPHSLAFYQGDLYVGDPHQVIRLRDADGDLVYEQREVLIDQIPAQAWHTTRTIVFDEINEKLYLGVGSPCDLCRSSAPVAGGGTDPLPPNPEWGAILEFNADGSGRRIFATGVRNAVGLALHPLTNELWGNNNGHDLEGRTRPPEWIDIIRDGDFMGHPFVHIHQVWNDFQIGRYQRMLPITTADSLLAARQKRPLALVPAHYAPMGLHFYTHDQFPDTYRHAAFVAFRAGQAKLSSHPGYNVSALFSDPDGSNARIGEFITGFQTGTTQQSVWGFPSGLVTDHDGSLYVGSDAGNQLILKVTYSPVGGSWQHNLPDSIAAGGALALTATIQVERLVAGGGPPRVTADLSELGGPAELPLEAIDADTYRLNYNLDLDGPSGRRSLRIQLAQEVEGQLKGFDFVKTIALLPQADLQIIEEGLAVDWRAASAGGAAALELTTGPVGAGTAAGLRVAPAGANGRWQVELQPPTSVDLLGYESLYFAFHPGDIALGSASAFALELNESTVDLLPLVDLARRQWQAVELPLSAFGLTGPIRRLRFVGDLTGTFYLDDLRFKLAQQRNPVAAIWTHDLPGAITSGNQLEIKATVRLTRFAPDGSAPIVSADLSALGGPNDLALIADGDTYRLDTHLDLEGVPLGPHRIWVRVEQLTAAGRHWQRLSHLISILPPDLLILDDAFADGWQLVGEGGAHVLGLRDTGPVFNGRAAATIEAEPANFYTPWAIELQPPVPVERGGWAGLRFAFHPVDTHWTVIPNMVLYIDGLEVDMVRGPKAFHIDLERPEWQVIEVPFTAFNVIRKYWSPDVLDSVATISSVRLESNVAGTFYLDDIRLVGGIPSAPPNPVLTAVAENRDQTLPAEFALEQNYPNPFNSQTKIHYALPQRSTVQLEVYNLLGQQVARLVYGLREAGIHSLQWDGRDNADKTLATGLYIYRLKAGPQTLSRKLMLIR